jgi:hypothetical protein
VLPTGYDARTEAVSDGDAKPSMPTEAVVYLIPVFPIHHEEEP